jgi:PPP family 3-phenylpropionic acid transporter
MSNEGQFSLYYFLLFGSIGAIAPFASLWLTSVGIEPAMIGTLWAAPSVVMLLTTIHLGRWADGLRDRRQAIVIGNWVILVAHSVLFVSTDFWIIVLIWIVAGIAMYANVPITDAAALCMSQQRGTDFARIRTFGSVGFVAALLCAGYAYEQFGIGIFIGVLLLANTLRLAYSYYLPDSSHIGYSTVQTGNTTREAYNPAIDNEQLQLNLKKPAQADALYQKVILLTLIGSALINSSHSMVYTFGILHWTQTGLSESLAGLAVGVGVLVEILLMWWFKL